MFHLVPPTGSYPPLPPASGRRTGVTRPPCQLLPCPGHAAPDSGGDDGGQDPDSAGQDEVGLTGTHTPDLVWISTPSTRACTCVPTCVCAVTTVSIGSG